ncbi:unnamed protein product [Sphenostylis stenocarpa]|uniref:Uncharacterized protein n=1 Tax=Sphenostylis stenocarpa TaxID=92480 RepID=A0AA86VDR2_9FABA|nr:unnamed protein product [Sphenostylis stenocarpa]
MFWKLASLSASSPVMEFYDSMPYLMAESFKRTTEVAIKVEAILDRDNFTLEELLDEEEVIQECKALNSRLIN